MTGRQRVCLSLFCLLAPMTAQATHYGLTFSTVVVSREIGNLNGYQLMFFYDPERYCWRNFNFYFDGGVSTFWASHSHHHTRLNIVSLAPVLRATFAHLANYTLYADLSVGVAYLNETYMANRDLGSHFAFQDRFGLGVNISNQLAIGIHVLHYSNAGFAKHNSGFTAPIVLDISYFFR